MPMGIVSDADFANELGNSSRIPRHSPDISPSTPSAEIKDIPNRGRKEGDLNVPETLRKVIGEEGAINGRQSALQLASGFGISPASASAYANGATSTASYQSPDAGLNGHITNRKEQVARKARTRLMKALNAITDENLAVTKPRELAGIAKDMSVIIKNMEPDEPVNPDGKPNGSPTFIIMAPQFRDEKTFEVVHAKDTY